MAKDIKAKASINGAKSSYSKESKKVTIDTGAYESLKSLNNQLIETYEAGAKRVKDISKRDIDWKGETRDKFDKLFKGLAEYVRQTEPIIKNFSAVEKTIKGQVSDAIDKKANVIKKVGKVWGIQ